jgi:recombination protein RecT
MAPWATDFADKNKYGLSFEAECHFAKQVIIKNKGVLEVAQNNPESLRNAIVNSSACGLSLNPILKHAYLVPREGAICLDISYLGLVKVGCDSGAIILAKPVLVHGKRGNYPGDKYSGRGPVTAPVHEYDLSHPDRINGDDPLENVVCGYCLAVTPSGVVVVEEMSGSEIIAVRGSSKAFSSGGKNPWKGPWSGQMGKKTLVKRASHSWPQTGDRLRLDTAISILDQHEGLREEELVVDNPVDKQGNAAPQQAPLCITLDQNNDLLLAIKAAGITNDAFCKLAGINSLGELPEERLPGAKERLKQIAMREQK